MNVSVPTAAAISSQSQAAVVPQGGKASSNGDFQQTLAKQIQSSPSTEGKNVVGNSGETSTPVQEAPATEASGELPVLSELMALIDSLLDSLEQTELTGEEPVLTEEQLTELESALDQLTALLALLGIPAATIMQTADQQTLEAMPREAQLVTQAAVVKSNMQDMLLQLHAAVEQGSLKHIQKQEPTTLIHEQLQALAALVNKAKNAASAISQDGAKAQELFQMMSNKTVDTSSLLQRLSQQSAAPSALTAAVNAESNGESSVQTESTASQQQTPVTAGQLSVNQGDLFRGALQMASRGANAPVPADQFAETMTGMIVQKFDIRTLNGISEAKLMLFPEHMGQVDVKITMHNGQLQAVFVTDTAMAKDALDNQMAQLRAALQSQGLVVDKLEVAQSSSAAGLLGQHKGQGNGQQQFTNQQSSNQGDGAAESSVESEVSELAAVQGLGFGRGINVTA